MFQEHLADITISKVKGHVQSTTVDFFFSLSSQGQAGLKRFKPCASHSCIIPSKHSVPSEGQVLKLVL